MKKIGNSQKVPMYALFFVLGLIFGVLLSNFIGAGMAKRAIGPREEYVAIENSNYKIDYKSYSEYSNTLFTKKEYVAGYSNILENYGQDAANDFHKKVVIYFNENKINPNQITDSQIRGIGSCDWWCSHLPWILRPFWCGCKEKETNDQNAEK